MHSSASALKILFGLLLLVVPFAHALKFDLVAQYGHTGKNERCIRNFVTKDTLVVVTATIGGNKGDGQQVNMHVRGQTHNPYERRSSNLERLGAGDISR